MFQRTKKTVSKSFSTFQKELPEKDEHKMSREYKKLSPKMKDAVDAIFKEMEAEGLPATGSPYPLLHSLPLFRDGFDLFTRTRGPLSGDYRGYKEGDLPVTEEMVRRLIFLPVLSDPVPGAAEKVVEAIRRGAARAR